LSRQPPTRGDVFCDIGSGDRTLDDSQLLRYSRHILLPELGVDAQQRYASSHALIVGVGGLGNPVAQFLAAAGVGTLTLVDADRVDLTNLQRQILFDTSAVGQSKVHAAGARIRSVNPEVRVVPVEVRVGDAELGPLAAHADVVIDCSDNFATRHAVNRTSVAAERPLVSGAAIRFDGQVVGTAVVTAGGTFSFSFTIPATAPLGMSTITADGVKPGGARLVETGTVVLTG